MIRRAPILVALLAGCGSTSTGSGTDTLYVDARSEGKPDSTELEIEVRRAGQRVEGANVFLEDGDGANAGRSLEPSGDKYKGKFPGYVRRMTLTITAGEDELSAALEGPSPHLITNPPSGAIVERGEAEVLTIEWSADSPADRILIDPDDLDAIPVEGDPGEHALPLAGLKDREQRIRVTRETSVDLAGGVEGSIWRAQYRVDNRFTLKR